MSGAELDVRFEPKSGRGGQSLERPLIAKCGRWWTRVHEHFRRPSGAKLSINARQIGECAQARRRTAADTVASIRRSAALRVLGGARCGALIYSHAADGVAKLVVIPVESTISVSIMARNGPSSSRATDSKSGLGCAVFRDEFVLARQQGLPGEVVKREREVVRLVFRARRPNQTVSLERIDGRALFVCVEDGCFVA